MLYIIYYIISQNDGVPSGVFYSWARWAVCVCLGIPQLMSQSLCSSSCVTMFRAQRRRHHPIPIRQLKESMKTYIIAKIKHEEIQHDKAQAAPSQDNASGSIISKEVRVSDNIRALRRAIMNVERAMELDDQMEEFEQYAETIGNDHSFAHAKYDGNP